MLYNRVKEHVVNDRKKMYKRGSQWVVVSAFALALGGIALTQLQPVNAAETDTHLVVQPVTLTQDGQVSQPAAAQTEPASAVKNTQPVATANAAKANGEASPAAAQQQATAAYQAASQAANANTSMPASSGMTEAEWQAQQAKYDQAKSDAAVSEAAEKQKTSEAEASYANSLASQAAAQKQQDQASLAAANSSAAASLAALKAQQDASYAAASQAATAQIDDLNAQRTTPDAPVENGGTFNYVAEHGLWTNVVTHKDNNSNWNGNYLVQNLPVFKDPSQAGLMDNIYVHSDDGQKGSTNETPLWSLGDTVYNNQLTKAQKNELNQYAMMLVNNYRKSMGLLPISTTSDFLSMVQKRGQTLTNTATTDHNPDITSKIFDHNVDETLSSISPSSYMGNRYNQNPTMLELMESVADSINGLFNFDDDSNQGHRNILLGGDNTAGFSLQYNTVQKAWIMNSNGNGYIYSGSNIATVPVQTSTPSTVQDNNKEIDQKIQTVKDNLQSFKNSQDQAYQSQKTSSDSAIQNLANQFAQKEDATQKDNVNKINDFNTKQNNALTHFINDLNSKVAAMDPGAKPSTPSSGASSSGASSATSSSSSSAASSSASSAGSSAASSAASSSASSAGSSAVSSAASSSASSAGSSAASSAASSSASSAGSSAASSAASSSASGAASSSASSAGSSAASSAASSSASSAGSSAASSAASSLASSAGSSAASSAASSSASSAANPKTSSAAVIPVVAAQPSSSQPMSRVAQKNGKHAYPATGESKAGTILAEAGAVVIAVLGLAGVRKYRHAK